MNRGKTDKLIDELVQKHGPRRVLPPPRRRAAVWCSLALTTAIVAYSLVQPFRSGFFAHMLSHPMLLLEMVSAAIFVWCGSIGAFQRTVPGERVSTRAKAVFLVAAMVFVTAVALSFSGLGAESTTHGGRHMCWLEVVACGGATLLVLVLFLRRGHPRFAALQIWLLALIAMLPAAALMQLACAYNPLHGLRFHYMPMLILSILALSAQRYLRR
jgi:hypothetical protein